MDSNTGENRPRKGQFVKGDPRINRKGRPKNFDALRALASQISHEVASGPGGPLIKDGHLVTVIEAIMRQWAASKDPRLQIAFVEVAFGKTPVKTEISGPGGGPIQVDDNDQLSDDQRAERAIALLDAARARRAGQAAEDKPDVEPSTR